MSQARTSSGSFAITAISARSADGVSRAIKSAYVRTTAGALSQIFDGVEVLVSPSYVSGAGYSKTPISITTSTTTVTAPSGSTFAWTSPDAGWSAINPTSAFTGFRKITVAAGVETNTTFTCTVALPSGSSTAVTVTADVSNNYESTQ